MRQQAIELYDRFTHEGMDRRDFMAADDGDRRQRRSRRSADRDHRRLARPRRRSSRRRQAPDAPRRSTLARPRRSLQAYVAEPRTAIAQGDGDGHPRESRPQRTYRDVARRLALAGFHAVAPDFLSPSGGTPANEDAARDAIGKLDLAAVDTHAGVRCSTSSRNVQRRQGKVGVVGFCWGGAFVNRLAVAAGDRARRRRVLLRPRARPGRSGKVAAPLLIHLAGLDERVNQTGFPWVTALRAAGKPVDYFSSMTGSITPSTTTRRPSATTRPPPTWRGSGRCASFRKGAWLTPLTLPTRGPSTYGLQSVSSRNDVQQLYEVARFSVHGQQLSQRARTACWRPSSTRARTASR